MPELSIADRVLFFPVTPFDPEDMVDRSLVEQHVGAGVEHDPGAVFAACGTGEYHALSVAEYTEVVAGSIAAVGGRVPVLSGVGGPLGHARDCAVTAQRLGVDGLLVLPPYLVQAPQEGMVRYVEAVAASTDLPLIVYHRGSSQFSVDSMTRLLRHPQVVGVKDGVGDVALVQRFVLEATRSERDVLFFNGLLTAELSQAAYTPIGVPLYSSAVFAMAPRIATAFHRAHQAGDADTQRVLLAGFYAPLVALRDETPGFGVSLIKAGVRLGGMPVGVVRPPLVDPTPEQTGRLERILQHGHDLVP